eukprot:scaffold3822_cov379-Prasinococcus_capsulatus_cf.AAC.6
MVGVRLSIPHARHLVASVSQIENLSHLVHLKWLDLSFNNIQKIEGVLLLTWEWASQLGGADSADRPFAVRQRRGGHRRTRQPHAPDSPLTGLQRARRFARRYVPAPLPPPAARQPRG